MPGQHDGGTSVFQNSLLFSSTVALSGPSKSIYFSQGVESREGGTSPLIYLKWRSECGTCVWIVSFLACNSEPWTC